MDLVDRVVTKNVIKMKKALLLFFYALFSIGMLSACSSDDEISFTVDDKLLLFEDSLQSIPEIEGTGYLYYDSHYGWTIVPPGYIDYPAIYYFPLNLPDNYKANIKESIRVSYSGKVIKMSEEEIESSHLWRYGGTESFYYVYLTKIEEIEIPYRGNPPFTIMDMPGTVFYDNITQEWYILYWLPNFGGYVNAYYPKEMSDEFKVSGGYNAKISGNVYEEYINQNKKAEKAYRIELTKIEKID